jgi:hypothetical protein
VVDSGVAAGVPFLVMDFVSGRTLADVLTAGALPAPRAVGLGRQILAGVKHAHTQGIVHRDLKPDNILLLSDVEGDFVKILDFGLAKVVAGDGESAATQLTNTGFALGTPGYMSPEQAKGIESDERSDLYAVGVILYHMVTGRKPFVADSPLAVLRMHMDDAPLPPNQASRGCCSADLERAILRALAKDPKQRFQTAAEFAKALAATSEAKIAPSPPGLDDEPAIASKRRPWWLTRRGLGWIGRGVVAAAVLVAVGWGWAHLTHRQQQNVKRHLNDAAKMANDAYKTVRTRAEDTSKPGDKTRPDKAADRPPEKAAEKTPPPEPKAETKPETASAEPPAPTPTTPALEPPQGDPAIGEPSGPAATDPEDVDDEVPVAPKDTPGARLEEQAQAQSEPAPKVVPGRGRAAKPTGPTTRDAARLLAAGRVDQAIQTLYLVRRHSPRNAEAALLLGHAYFKKLWRTDGLREYDQALDERPSLRWDKQMLHNAVFALDDPTYGLARSYLRKWCGASAVPELRRAARDGKTAKLQARAGRLAVELAHAKPRAH